MGDSMSTDPERIGEGIDAVLESLHSAMKANPRTAEPEPQKRPPAKVIQLPLWPEPVRGMPNPALRSALFAAVQSKDRRFINYELITALNGIEIRFKGEQLNQEDLEVCAQVFHLARLHPLADTCHMAAHAFLKSIGRHTGNSEHIQLHQSLLRLQAHSVQIKAGRYIYFGSLIEKGIKDQLTRRYLIKVNPDLAPLFHNGWTALDAEQRRRLRGKSLALWLHAFYASHEKPFPYKVETLRDLCGSRDKTLRSFRQKLRRALDELQATGAITGWEIAPGDLIQVDKISAITCRRRTPTKAQK
jgi:hypothetical protein